MNSALPWVLAGICGMALGAFFYGGLWWTVRRGVTARQPVLWFVGSMVVRIGVAGTGFFLVGQGQWQRLAASLLGFILARKLALIATAEWEARHAS